MLAQLRTLRYVITPKIPVFVAKLAGTKVFDPLGDEVGRVRDVVILLRPTKTSRAVGLVVEVPGRKRVFLPLSRVVSIKPGQVISTGLLNMRRFAPRPTETLAISELLERVVEFKDGSGAASIVDLAIEQQPNKDWFVTKLHLVRVNQNKTTLGIKRKGESLTVSPHEVASLDSNSDDQGVRLLLEAYDELKPADLADVLHELNDVRRGEIAQALTDERLADVLEELPEDDQVAILSQLESNRAADVLEVMQPDDAADLLHELPKEQANVLLSLMEPDEAKDVRRLLAYGENTAGGMMTTEPVILTPETSIAAALAHIRRADLSPALASTVFVVRPPTETPTGKLLGMVHFQRLLREAPHAAIGSILDADVVTLNVHDSLDRVARLLATYNLLVIPVVDNGRRLLGAVSVDDALDHMLPADWREADDDGGEDA